MMVSGKFWLYINGTLTSSDTVGKRSASQLDSIVGIASLVKGGDNDICLHVINTDSTFRGCALLFTALLDTTQHFTPSGKYAQRQAAVRAVSTQPAGAESDAGAGKSAPAAKGPSAAKELPYDKQFKSRGELLKAVVEYQKKAETVGSEVKKERLEVQKLRIKSEDLDEQIRKVKEETALLKKQLEGMNRGK